VLIILEIRQVGIALPAVCYDSAPMFDVLLYEPDQILACRRVNTFEPYPPYLLAKAFDRYNYKGLFLTSPACFAASVLLWPGFSAAYECFVHLYFSLELLSVLAYHSPSKLVQPGPGRLIAAEPHEILEIASTDPGLLCRYPPHDMEPQ